MFRSFKFMIAEDDPPTRGQLGTLLDEVFPGSTIDNADNVADGNELLQTALGGNRCYDAAILDFKLPAAAGENPEIDGTLCDAFRQACPGTLIIHMTAFDEDPKVWKHLFEVHNEPPGPQAILIAKNKVDWPVQLVEKLKKFLYGRDISGQLDDLFGRVGVPGGAGAGVAAHASLLSAAGHRERGVTHRLALLTHSIEAHWNDLDEALRRRINDLFVVDEGTEVRVSLL